MTLRFILSMFSGYSIAIAALVGLIRFKKIDKSYQPFIFICLLALVNEIISNVYVYTLQNNSINNNIYSLLEALLYIWLFRNWGHFRKGKTKLSLTVGLLLVLWVVDNLVWHSLKSENSLYWVVYCFTLIFLALSEINKLIMNIRGVLLKDSRFLICMGIVVFYTYYAIITIFLLLELNFSLIFYSKIYMVLQAVNFLINLVFALAILWAPKKLRFILQF